MSATPNLGLPYIDAGQAQKHVTHNEALRSLDTLVQLAVLDRDLTAPPPSPAEGQRWIVKTGATDAWSSHTDHIAAWQDGAWQFSAPVTGWVAYVIDEEILVAWDGDSWNTVSAGSGGGDPTELQDMTLLGIGTTADTTNPFSAKLNNALWAAQTVAEGGDGTLRYKLSKESAAKTLSLVFQDNSSGRAEIGLTGDDDFHFKVSPDGAAWFEGIKIDRASGRVSFPVSGGPREVLTANRTYFVSTSGSDSNNGLTVGTPFATLNKARDAILNLDLYGFTVTIQHAGSQTPTSGISWTVSPVGGNVILDLGGSTLGTTSANAVSVLTPMNLTVQNITVQTTASGSGLFAGVAGANITLGANVVFGACATNHIFASTGGVITANVAYSITGAAVSHLVASTNATIVSSGAAVTLTGSLNFSGGFAVSRSLGAINTSGNTYTGGTITGVRYAVSVNGIINTFGGGANYFPGNSAGTAATGGQYA